MYSSADFSVGIFITVGILIFRFIIKQSQKKKTQEREPLPSVTDFVSTSEDAIAQMLGEYKLIEKKQEDDSFFINTNDPIVQPKEEVLVEERLLEDEFKRDSNYRIKQKKRSQGAYLIDSKEELKRAVILQEILSPPLSKR